MTKTGTHHPRFRARSELHLARKLWHASAVGAMFLIYRYAPLWVSMTSLFLATVTFLPLDFLRLQKPRLNKKLTYWLRAIIREHELKTFAGTTYLLIGTWIILLIFPRPIVEMTLLFLAVGDPFASLCGIYFGGDKILGNKTLQGSMGAFFVCTLLAFGYFYLENKMVERLFLVSVSSGVIAATSELIPVKSLDDNLTFPVLCATQLYLLFMLFGEVFSH